jgi:hypothetical protein
MKRLGLFFFVVLLALPTPAPAQDDTLEQAGEGFIAALNVRDFQGMAGFFSPDAKGRFLTPGGYHEATGGTEVGDRFRRWFGGAPSFEIAESGIENLGSEMDSPGTTLHLFYEFRLVYDGQPYHGEQHVYVVFEDGLIASIDLLCSGFFPDER